MGPQGEEGPPGAIVAFEFGTYTVKAGDTLWSIAAEACSDDASVRETVRRMLAIWVTNIETVGSDSNSIDVGQRLFVPVPP